jgi:hypothetical protein
MRAPAIGLVLASVLASLASSGCATYHDELNSGERAFEASEDERALAIFRALEPDSSRLNVPDRAHYAYLRGMTDYRIGYKADARHWLSLATALEQQTPGAMPAEWTKRMSEALKDLNEQVFATGLESLSTAGAGKNKANDDDDSPGADPESNADPDAAASPTPGPVRSNDE